MWIEQTMEQLVNYVSGFLPKGLHFLLALIGATLILVIGFKLVKKIVLKVKASLIKKGAEPGVVSFLASAVKLSLDVLLIIVAAQVLGLETSSVIAVVGSAGLAIGLALQGSLANFAGGVLILMMKPFTVGDYIISGDVEGTVKKIDIVYTTLSTVDNRAVILPNGKLADSNIINVTKEDKRRIDINVGVDYSSNVKKVKDCLQQIVDKQENRLKDMPVDIVVGELSDSAITMTVHMWVKPEEYWPTRWKMLEEIKEEFEKNQIVIPFKQLDVTIKNQ